MFTPSHLRDVARSQTPYPAECRCGLCTAAATVRPRSVWTDGPPPGTTVSVPVLLSSTGVHRLTYNNDYPCGYAQLMLLSAPLIAVPNGLHPQLAALTEPLAVGVHAVAKSAVQPGDTAVVLGCGPIGLTIIAALRAAGVETVIGPDFSPPQSNPPSRPGDSPPVPARSWSLRRWAWNHPGNRA